MPRLSQLPLSRQQVDRASEQRVDPEYLTTAWAHPRAGVLTVRSGRAPIDQGGNALLLTPTSELNGSVGEWYFLGVDDEGAPFFAVRDDDHQVQLDLPESNWAGLRDVGGLLSDRDAGLFVHALGLANWHAAHEFCAKCGAGTNPVEGGHVRRCPACGADHFPRTDPAIIVLVTDDEDRCLLGHGAQWPPGRFSTIAGFVEPGEALEHAVIREVHEETGVHVADPVYMGSQPWPFPSSLMLGFFADATSTEIQVDGTEVDEARWFSRAELRAAYDSGELHQPTGISIAKRLIEAWYGEPL